MKRQKGFYITESQIRNVIRKSVSRYLREGFEDDEIDSQLNGNDTTTNTMVADDEHKVKNPAQFDYLDIEDDEPEMEEPEMDDFSDNDDDNEIQTTYLDDEGNEHPLYLYPVK